MPPRQRFESCSTIVTMEDLRLRFKTCTTCGFEKSVSEFSMNKSSATGRRSNCKECARVSKHNWYQNNKDKTLSATQRRRADLNVKLVSAKRHPCTDCGQRFHHSLMQFDHVRGEKLGSVSYILSQTMSWSKAEEEIDKCELVCVMCHCARTWNRVHPDDQISGEPIII